MSTWIKLTSVLAAAALLVNANPVVSEKRQDTAEHCGQWDVVTYNQYSLLLDQWGKDNAESGQTCASITSASGDSIAWTTTFTWTGTSDTGVKAYPNLQLDDVSGQIGSISSMPTSWSWSLTDASSDIVANIAYDIFTSSTAGGSNEFEIMIWMANYNAGPISYTYNAEGNPTPVAESVSIAGSTWDVYHGSNGSNEVYSFLTSDGSEVTSFDGDAYDFFSYLISDQGFSTSQYLTTFQAGTEQTLGSGTLVTSSYSASIA
ncbi:concanavalin A-like lectin/glucanase domain-containing protein [Schizophyllum amplum]|uniref:Concanavalin A-like lectin/glucanase domain-containing protein n=1 Tax=Schizophyllum amplum TaxID=97359 RepID=A0A550C5W9_9AGAR|nr:concanavalin A-like lectin/glucanase domain-containing protein [Auriculariopsis ampla]